MIFMVAPQKAWADLVAKERGLHFREWRYVGDAKIERALKEVGR